MAAKMLAMRQANYNSFPKSFWGANSTLQQGCQGVLTERLGWVIAGDHDGRQNVFARRFPKSSGREQAS
jgi:hypothetical protein